MRARQIAWMVVLALASTAGSAAAGHAQESAGGSPKIHGQREGDERRQGQRRSSKWWMDPTDRAELGISDDQSARLEAIFQSAAPAQRDRWREHERLEPVVEKLIKDGSADAGHVAQQVERVETLKAQMNATRILMLYRMQQELSAPQRDKLKRLLERREAERRKSTDSHVRR